MSCNNISQKEIRRIKIAREVATSNNKVLMFTETTKICPNIDCESYITKDYRFLLLSTKYIKICAYCDTHLFWNLEKGQTPL